MAALSLKLAHSLADRLNAALPQRYRVQVVDGELALFIDGQHDMTSCILHIADDNTRSLSERLETATHSILSAIQDAISEMERAPWPSNDGRTMAPPGSRLDQQRLVLWYGDEGRPLLSLPPINLRELGES